MRKVMREWKMLFILTLVSFLLTGCMSLFTALTINPPASTESSMLVLENADGESGETLYNTNVTGWTPLI